MNIHGLKKHIREDQQALAKRPDLKRTSILERRLATNKHLLEKKRNTKKK